MDTTVVSTTAYIPFSIFDAGGDPVAGRINADFTKTAYLASTPATTATPTVTEVSGGRYVLSVTPTAVGIWHVAWSVSVDGETARYEETVRVITPAQADPAAALASTVSAVTTLTERLTNARAARLDLITTGRIITRQPVAVDGTISLRPGESYAAADGRQIDVTSDGWPDLDGATITFTITALGAASATISKAASTVAATAPDQTVRIELTTAETALLSRSGVYRYSIDATIGGDPYHLASDSVAMLG